MFGYAGDPDGADWVRDRLSGDPEQPAALGETLAERMLAAGAREILRRVEERRRDCGSSGRRLPRRRRARRPRAR